MPDQDPNLVGDQGSLDRSVRILAQRVDLLEIASHEKHRPWYKQPSVILSVVALLVSLGTTIYTQRASKQETIRSRKEELRKLTINLVELRQLIIKGMTSPDGQELQSGSIQQRVILGSALRLAGQIPKEEVSAYQYSILAQELQAAGETSEAERYFRAAVDTSGSTFEKTQALMWLGIFYFGFGPKQSFENGRDAFGRAAQPLEQQSDPYAIDLRGLTLETWAGIEFQYGFVAQGNAKLEEARAAYSKLPQNFPYRATRLDDLDRRVKRTGGSFGGPLLTRGELKPPDDVARALQQLSSDDLREIAEQEGGTTYGSFGNDETENRKEKEHYDRLVATGLAKYLSNADVQAHAKEEKTHFDYGFTTTDLYDKTREFVFTALLQSLANAQLSH